MKTDLKKDKKIGLYVDGKFICSCEPLIQKVYYKNAEGMLEAYPSFMKLLLMHAGGEKQEIIVSSKELNYAALRQKSQLLYCASRQQKELLEEHLSLLLRHKLKTLATNDESSKGIYFDKNGWQILPGGQRVFVYGRTVFGEMTQEYLFAPYMEQYRIDASVVNASLILVDALAQSSPVVTGIVAFVMQSVLRSIIISREVDVQSALYIVGPQGVGKTTVAKIVAGFLREESSARSKNIFDAGSSIAALRESMTFLRDMPLIIDDLCHSAGSATERNRKELGAKIIREATNGSAIVKKSPSGKVQGLECAASIILTAEFALQNESDVTRCIFVPLKKTPNIASCITHKLMQKAVIETIEWVALNYDNAVALLHKQLLKPIRQDLHPRITTNLSVLQWA